MNASMNSSLEDLNDLIFEHNKPEVIFITVFMLFGIVGNSLVLYVYAFRIKRSTLKLFIVYLGVVDMLGCCLGIPLDLVELIMPLMYPSNILCKAQKITIYFSGIASVLSIFAIAVERFNRVCRPFARQLSSQHAKRIVISVTLISFLFAVPACLAFKKVEKLLDNGLVSYQCMTGFNLYLKIFFLIMFFFFLLLLFIIFVLYLFIWKGARHHFRQVETHRQKQLKNEADRLTQANHRVTKYNPSHVNIMIFSLIALFVVSFAPNFILHLAQISHSTSTFIGILHRFWVLNCSLNPLVYGICNGEFRQAFKSVFFSEINKKSHRVATENMAIGLKDVVPVKSISVI